MWRPRLLLTAALALTLIALTAVPALASSWNVGDVFLGVESGTYQVRAPDGTLKDTLSSTLSPGGFTTGCAVDKNGDLYGTMFSNSAIVKYAGLHPHAESLFGTGGPGFATPESVTFDAAGNVFIGQLGRGLDEYLPNGTFVKNVITTQIDWFDISADQDTVLYTQEGNSILRVSIATGTVLTPFTSGTASRAFALRILKDGGVLLADLNQVKRYNAAGAVIQTYDVTGEDTWFSLNLDPDGTTFWAGNYGSANYYRFNINTGAVAGGPINTGTPGNLFGICLKGEIRAADAAIVLTPPTATNQVGTSHTVTATLADGKQGVTITFRVTAGPNTGKTGTGVTDATGKATFTYTGTGGAGTDTIQAEYTAASGALLKSNEVFKTWTAPTDTTKPTCVVPTAVGTDATGKKYAEATVQDTGSGLATVVVTSQTNANTVVPPFTPGTTSPVVVRSTKINQSAGSTFALRVTDVAGNVTNCDPVLTVTLRDTGKPTGDSFSGLAQSEGKVTIVNGKPGLNRIDVTVNGVTYKLTGMKDNERRTLDVSASMNPGTANSITITGHGSPSASAIVVISD